MKEFKITYILYIKVLEVIKMKIHKMLYLATILLLFVFASCKNNNIDKPLMEILKDVTLVVPDMKVNEKGKPIKFVVGDEVTQKNQVNFYHGVGNYYIENIGTLEFNYRLAYEQAIEVEDYIFVPVEYYWGGPNTFHYLTAIEKKSLKSVDDFLLGNRLTILNVNLSRSRNNIVSIKFRQNSVRSEEDYNPNKVIEKRFTLEYKQLKELTLDYMVSHDH